ncbi:MAG: hypothetical protein GF421_05715 [Candidatus Aminicenantes bacterium]|nr:hypothetical protein [Candidatus Aminicenantes bacterium]
MNIKTKVIFIVIIVFVIGLLTGFMLNRVVIQKRIKDAFSRVNPNRIPSFYERVLEPNQETSSQIRRVLFKHAKKVRNIREDYQKQMEKANQSLYNELAPLLSPVQRDRLNQRLHRAPRHTPWTDRFVENFPVMRVIEKDVEFLKARLSLNQEQTLQVRRILRKYKIPLSFPRRKNVNKKNKTYLDLIQRAAQRDKAIKKVLDPSQERHFEKIKRQFN